MGDNETNLRVQIFAADFINQNKSISVSFSIACRNRKVFENVINVNVIVTVMQYSTSIFTELHQQIKLFMLCWYKWNSIAYLTKIDRLLIYT